MQKHAHMRSDWPVNLSKCLNVASFWLEQALTLSKLVLIKLERDVPLTALAKLRIGRELGCVNLELDYEAVKREASTT